MQDLKNKKILITGASKGIGKALVLDLAKNGAAIGLVARNEAALREVCREIAIHKGAAFPVAADLAERDTAGTIISRALKELGDIDVLINAAGIQAPIGLFVDNDLDTWERNLRVNLLGPVRLIHATLPIMIAKRQGKIINFSGGGATAPRANFSAYATAKAALVRFTETLAVELAPHHIQINAVAPGAINTSMVDEVLAAGKEAGAEYQQALERAKTGGTPVAFICDLVRFLISPESGELTGKLISAPYDPWREWAGQAAKLNSSPLYTIRRMDLFTIKPLIKDLG